MNSRLKKEKEYQIPFAGLKPGTYTYQFDLKGPFFGDRQSTDISDADMHVTLTLDRLETMMTLRFDFKGWVELTCDRCADLYKQEMDGSRKLIVKLADEAEELSDELVTIHRDESELDVSGYLYEFAALLLPIKREHPVGENGQNLCDPEVLKVLDSLAIQETEKPVDERWAALKQLK
ncbi:MAG: DUF177 domain-containing protein [Flavobacteriales bacterium]|nr:DUF177 domain-containing protein [Flavobacteriales bacterium]MCB9449381.1 DUF177 domain-containing protein [Flavobacteriales bacterium]